MHDCYVMEQGGDGCVVTASNTYGKADFELSILVRKVPEGFPTTVRLCYGHLAELVMKYGKKAKVRCSFVEALENVLCDLER